MARLPRGAGSIHRRGSGFDAYYRDHEGRQRTRRFGDEQAAELFLLENYTARKKAKAAGAPAPDPGRQWTVGELLAAWLRSKYGPMVTSDTRLGTRRERPERCKEGTWRNLGTHYRRLNELLGPVSVELIGPEQLEAVIERMREARPKDAVPDDEDAGLSLGWRSTRQSMLLLRRALDWGRARDYVQRPDPFATVTLPEQSDAEQEAWKAQQLERVPSASELKRLVLACPRRGRGLMRCMAELAMRFGEASGLLIENYDPQARTLEVTGQRLQESGTRVDYAKTSNAYRAFQVSDALHSEIEERLALKPGPRELLWVTGEGSGWWRSNFARDCMAPAVAKVKDGAGTTPHSLRHGRLTAIAQSGKMSVVDLAKFAGHDDEAFTLRTYAKWYERESPPAPGEYLS